MKKSIIILFVLVLSLALAAVASAAVPAPGGPFNTAFNIQNLSTTDPATCTIQLYDGSGNLDLTLSPPAIAAGDVADFYTGSPSFASLAPDQYSAVISCDQPVAAVVNFSDSDSGASHSGLDSSEVGTNFFAPSIYDNYYGFYSNVIVQNTTSGPINITVDYLAPGGASAGTQTASNVPAFSSVSFDQSGNTGLNNNIAYSAVIQGTGNVAAVVNIYGGSGNQQLYSYNPFASGATTFYAPIIMNNYYGYNSALTVQNIDSSTPANVTVTYSNGAVESQSISPRSSHVFLNFLTPGLTAGNTLYSAKLVSNGSHIVATVNQSNALNRAATYNGVQSGSTTVNAPIVLRSYYGYDSSVTCQNIGTLPTNISIAYASGQNGTIGTNVPASGTASLVQLFDSALGGVGGNYISSATITASQPIVCVVNQDQIVGAGATTSKDVLQSYNAIGN
jgi:hypothetical protein